MGAARVSRVGALICLSMLTAHATAQDSADEEHKLVALGRHTSLGFMHIFKTSGTAYGVALAKYARAHGIPFYTDMVDPDTTDRGAMLPRRIYEVNKGARHLIHQTPPKSSPFSIFHGHTVDLDFRKMDERHRGAFQQFMPQRGPAPLFATVLREPTERLMSAFLQLTFRMQHKAGGSFTKDTSKRGATMDKERIDEMFEQWLLDPLDKNFHQCILVPKQLFGPWAVRPCSSSEGLDEDLLRRFEAVLKGRFLPLIADRQLESARLLDSFLARSQDQDIQAPSVAQLMEVQTHYRCHSYSAWRKGHHHARMEPCTHSDKDGGVRGAKKYLTPAVRRVVESVMGYELWLYSKGNQILSSHLREHGIDSTKAQEFECNPQTKQGCSEKQKVFIDEMDSKGDDAIRAEITRLKKAISGRVQTPEKEAKVLRRLAVVEGLVPTAFEDGGPGSTGIAEQDSHMASEEL